MEDTSADYSDVVQHDDHNSVTSTSAGDYDSEKEWEVKDVLAEGIIAGEKKYLIEWDGFPLHDATWEPVENLGGPMIADWEEAKKQKGHKKVSNSRIRAWREAIYQRVHGKMNRHNDRNRKRIERGLQATEYEHPLEEILADLDDLPQGEDEEEEAELEDGEIEEGQDGENELEIDGPEKEDTTLSHTTAFQVDPSALPQPTNRQTLNVCQTQPVSSSTLPNPSLSSSRESESGNRPTKSSVSSIVSQNAAQRPGLETNGAPPPVRRKSQATSNVFVGGKERKKRRSLAEVATDPTRGPVMLRLRQQRQLELTSRNKDGVTAPLRPTNVFQITGEPPSSTKDPTSSSSREDQSSTSCRQSATQQSPANTAEAALPSLKKKKKKMVCFVDEPEEIEPDPEPSLFIDDPQPAPYGEEQSDYSTAHSGDQRTSLLTLQTALGTSVPRSDIEGHDSQPICLTKATKFSPKTVASFSITYCLPPNTMPEWISKLKMEQTLVFTHACLAKDFLGQYQKELKLFKGSLTSTDHLRALKTTAQRLQLGSFGLLCHLGELCILVYPTECEDWKMQTQSMDDITGMLSVVMFDAGDSLRRWDLAPISFSPDIGHQDLPPGMRPAIFSRVLGFEYSSLLPMGLQVTTEHPFFLAFPPTIVATEEMHFVAQWLRSSNPDCRILTSLLEGHWRSFLNCSRGVIIIHEDAIWAMLSFPILHRLLATEPDKFSFWVFERSLRASRLVSHSSDTISNIGDIRLQPILEHGVAVLVTPSFLVSQHNQAYALIKWYYDHQDKYIGPHQRLRIVVCAKIDEWLFELYVDKMAKLETASHAAQRVIEDAAEATKMTYSLILDLVEASKDQDSILSPLIFAPSSIDGNDEQSLTNWFGWWSIMNLSQFREFTLMGSAPDAHPASLVRCIKCPNFAPLTTSNPEEAYQRRDKAHAEGNSTSYQIVANDQPANLIKHLDTLIKEEITPKCPLVLYKFPVSYWDKLMSYNFGDYDLKFADYTKCFKWFRPFGELQYQATNHNTMTALFYTIEGHWDPDAFDRGVMPPRRPWIALHRPVNLHRKPWLASELLIWDLSPEEKFTRRKDIHKDDLIEAQREFIRIFREENRSKNPGQLIDRVWFGGFEASWKGYSKQLDATLAYLTEFIHETQYWLPIPERIMLERGWKMVNFRQTPPASPGDPMDIDEPYRADDIEDIKIVFHPLRGQPSLRTKCHNRLYRSTKDFLNQYPRKEPGDLMEYTFRPTLDWYQEQLAEDKGYEHISVTTWEQFRKRFGIREF
ncbi:hypothetical protein BGZ63DRAFT_74729 [Mariannaea sp. PMI_226]|nr:hypothetical protein BGZ63DRAFT_74729 [Mariannaea sp. PMI_226]